MQGYEEKYTRLAGEPETERVVDAQRKIVWINLEAREGAKIVAILPREEQKKRAQ